MNKKRFFTTFIAVIFILTLLPAAKKPVSESTNNLSFPAIAVDGYSIVRIPATTFTTPYSGSYADLTAEEIAWLLANGDPINNAWYPQKTTGNIWQAEFDNTGAINGVVTIIDWSDNIESQQPKTRASFRLELTLYKILESPMTAYTMKVLEFPNSASELQGTNTQTSESYMATIVSGKPKLLVQHIGAIDPQTLTWDEVDSKWISGDTVPNIINVGFAPELNVGGKYIYGASAGGWKPRIAGLYRITFYVPVGSNVNLAMATFDNEAGDYTPTDPVAFPVLVPELNLTYVDVTVSSR